MEASIFIKEYNRMCTESVCLTCPIGCRLEEDECEGCIEWQVAHPDETVAIVERWALTHPELTNAQKYAEVFGYLPKTAAGRYVCPAHCVVRPCRASCDECEAWWDEPYKKPAEFREPKGEEE